MPTAPAEEDIIGVERAAAILQIHPATLKKLARAKKIPARRIGRQWRFSESALRRHIGGAAAK